MIVRETEDCFVMTTQHEHARLSGDIARRLRRHLFLKEDAADDVLYAVYQHDRGWIRLDRTPVWNDRATAPYSFMDYPLLPKLTMYRRGIDEVEAVNAYAALLCSLHYSSFSALRQSAMPECRRFIADEAARQARLRKHLGALEEEAVARHFSILQICDELSLYACFNEPGIGKEEEHPWYRDGFATRLEGPEAFAAHWENETTVVVAPALFESDVNATLRVKAVGKRLAAAVGIDRAYRQTEWTEQTVTYKNGMKQGVV